MKQAPEPVLTAHLFPEIRAELLNVLRGLHDENWQRLTACEGWTVKDVALHILADDIGYLSNERDHDGAYFQPDSWEDLVSKVNAHNDLWIRAARRISRRLLLSMLELTGEQFVDFVTHRDLSETQGPVDWVGEEPAPGWLAMAREYTEHWMHTQHIFDAVGERRLRERRYMHPAIATFVHALPRTYQRVKTPADTTVVLNITGEAADKWYIISEGDYWGLYAETDLPVKSVVIMQDDTAWRLFTKNISPAQALNQTTIEGDERLGRVVLDAVSIIA